MGKSKKDSKKSTKTFDSSDEEMDTTITATIEAATDEGIEVSSRDKVHVDTKPIPDTVSEPVKQALTKMGIMSLFEVQFKTLDAAMNGDDMIIQARTGSGKTLGFALPTVERLVQSEIKIRANQPRVLAMAPTRELAGQICKVFNDLCENLPYQAIAIYGGSSYEEQRRQLNSGKAAIVVGTPGRLKDLADGGSLDLSKVKVCILDEVDRMLDMGFSEIVEEILGMCPYPEKIEAECKKPQTLFFSATCPAWVTEHAKKYMHPDPLIIKMVDNANISGLSTTVEHLCIQIDKFDAVATCVRDLVRLYSAGRTNGRAIVFTKTKKEANDLALGDIAIGDAQVMHGDIEQKQREVTLKGFREGKFRCLVATDVAARGLDIPQIDLVCSTSPPTSGDIESYVHRSGRTGRAGKAGVSCCIFNFKNKYLLQNVERETGIKFREIPIPQPVEVARTVIKEKLQDTIKDTIEDDRRIYESFLDIARDVIKSCESKEQKEATEKTEKKKKKKSKKSRSRRRSSSESDSSDEDRRRRKSRKDKKKRRKRRRDGSPTESVSVYDPLTAASRIVKITKEEKARLLEVARKNALQMTGATKTLSKNDEIAIRAGGLTLEQLTEKCNDIAKGKIDVMDLLGRGEVELMNHPFDPRKQGEVDYNWAGEKDFSLHNNQRTNALAITAGKSKDELVREYPISAGVSHRKKEDALEDIYGKWEASNSQDAAADLAERMQRRSEMLGEDEGYFGNSWQPAPMGLGQKDLEDKGIGFNEQLQNPNGPNIILARGDEQVFDDPKNSYIMQEMDKLMKQKAELERQVQKAPNDLQLIAQMYTIEEKLQAWARKRDAPGEWSGGTDAPRLLTRDELEGQGKEAWATADMFEGAQEVQGVGRRLLEKMGWSDGQALGKLGVGDVEPLVIDFKLDRRGLNAIDEVHKGQKAKLELRASTQPLNILSGKHPVSAINEVCQKRRWPLPTWTTIESGHRWKMAIRVCEETYTPDTFASTKKTAKMAAARVSLIEMGLIPADTPVGMECAALEAAGQDGSMKF